jgi:Ni,Fe-hydrogenase III small subunit
VTDTAIPSWRRLVRNQRTRPVALSPAIDEAAVRDLAARLDAAGIRRLGRGLSLHAFDPGSCGGCELELRALGGLAYDLARFGLRFVDSPRQADVLLVTGPVTRNLRAALLQGWEAAPEPRFVVAIGDCAIDGGVFKGSYAIAGGVDTTLPVDLVVRGCPPSPEEALEGLLVLLEANALPRG